MFILCFLGYLAYFIVFVRTNLRSECTSLEKIVLSLENDKT